MSSDSRMRELRILGGQSDGLAVRLLRHFLSQIKHGNITVILPSSKRIEHRGRLPGEAATLILHRWRAIRRLISHGDVGFAEAYMDGDWSSPDLSALLQLAARNGATLDQRISGLLLVRVLKRVTHLLRANNKTGSRRNISFHYDLGNAFYSEWLDPSLNYSSALYSHPEQTLEEAQDAKLARIEKLLDLRGGETVLEIGCGWGALAMRLARSGAHVTGITLSSAQLELACQRVEQENLAKKVTLQLTDYRDVTGSYDRIVSIEMLEAVGEAYWPIYFKTLHERLRTGGRAVLQAITINEARFDAYRRSADFIQCHVFPGGMLPTKQVIAEQARLAGFTLISSQSFGDSYATTLAEWRKRFRASWPSIAEMGLPKRFRRLWEYYLCYCEVGFRARTIDVGFYVLAKATGGPNDAPWREHFRPTNV